MSDPDKDAREHNENEARMELAYDREKALDAQYNYAASRPDVVAQFLIAADATQLIAKFLELGRRASTFSGMAGPLHEDGRKKLVYEMDCAARKCNELYAESHS